ncbi:MAG: HD domain-containing protein [Bacteroidales bacterium]|jgi:uncharacterized protein|nr:HD domain-containing protein [Bacteroidales bacterium]
MSPDFVSIHTFVKEALRDAEGGHDYLHALRVCALSEKLLCTEAGNHYIVKAAALLHDVFDTKFYTGTPESVYQKLMEIVLPLDFSKDDIQHVYDIIMNMSYKGGFSQKQIHSSEFFIVRDADRLDALGAIGVARAFSYGGNKGRALYNPDEPPQVYANEEEYRNSRSHTINHFYEKLFDLPETLVTATAKKIAQKRLAYMKQFVAQFEREWNQQDIDEICG